MYNSCIAWVGFELTTLAVIGTDCIGSCISNYHTTTTKSPLLFGPNSDDLKLQIYFLSQLLVNYNHLHYPAIVLSMFILSFVFSSPCQMHWNLVGNTIWLKSAVCLATYVVIGAKQTADFNQIVCGVVRSNRSQTNSWF
jgi:hypothetical protein